MEEMDLGFQLFLHRGGHQIEDSPTLSFGREGARPCSIRKLEELLFERGEVGGQFRCFGAPGWTGCQAGISEFREGASGFAGVRQATPRFEPMFGLGPLDNLGGLSIAIGRQLVHQVFVD